MVNPNAQVSNTQNNTPQFLSSNQTSKSSNMPCSGMCKTEVKYTGARLQKHYFQLHRETQRRLRQLHPVTVYVTLREQCTNLFIITNKCTITIIKVYITAASLYIIHTPTCFEMSMSSSGSSTSAPC
jgi:hypothetical protein